MSESMELTLENLIVYLNNEEWIQVFLGYKLIVIPLLIITTTILFIILQFFDSAKTHRWHYTRCYQTLKHYENVTDFCHICLYGPKLTDFEAHLSRTYPEVSFYGKSKGKKQTLKAANVLYTILRGTSREFSILCGGSSEMFATLQTLVATLGGHDSPAFLNVLFTLLVTYRLPSIPAFRLDLERKSGYRQNNNNITVNRPTLNTLVQQAYATSDDFVPSFANLSSTEQEWTRATIAYAIDVKALVLGELPPEAMRDFVRLVSHQSWNKAKTLLLLSVLLLASSDSQLPFDSSIDSQICKTLKYFTDGRVRVF